MARGQIARIDGQPDSMSGCARWHDADADDDHVDTWANIKRVAVCQIAP
jgi:hypothetical protein